MSDNTTTILPTPWTAGFHSNGDGDRNELASMILASQMSHGFHECSNDHHRSEDITKLLIGNLANDVIKGQGDFRKELAEAKFDFARALCEVKEAVKDEGRSVRELIQSIERDKLRDENTILKLKLCAPVCPV